MDPLSTVVLVLTALNIVVQAAPQISKTIKQALADVVGSLGAIAGSGAIDNPNLTTILAAFTNEIAVLKNDPNLPADVLSQIANFETIMADAIAAEKAAQTGEQPLDPLDPVQ